MFLASGVTLPAPGHQGPGPAAGGRVANTLGGEPLWWDSDQAKGLRLCRQVCCLCSHFPGGLATVTLNYISPELSQGTICLETIRNTHSNLKPKVSSTPTSPPRRLPDRKPLSVPASSWSCLSWVITVYRHHV